jgi:sugar lactone lactonase YvrE
MPHILKPTVVAEFGATHGEGPVWNARDQRLDWTDLKAGKLHRFDPVLGTDSVVYVGSPLGCFAPRERGGYVLGVEAGFALLQPDGSIELVAHLPATEGSRARLNDGKVDPQGRFWAGTMAYSAAAGAGALYRLDPDLSVTRALDGVTISNGLDWSSDGRTLYYIDSLCGQRPVGPDQVGIDAFDFDPTEGTLSNRRAAIRFPNARSGPTWMTLPDGMALDAAGHLWVAVAGGGEVRRYAPTGELDSVVEMPIACPTSVAFGGPDLTDLYITSMTLEEAVPPAYRRHDAFSRPRPLEGALFRCRTAVPGRASSLFKG